MLKAAERGGLKGDTRIGQKLLLIKVSRPNFPFITLKKVEWHGKRKHIGLSKRIGDVA